MQAASQSGEAMTIRPARTGFTLIELMVVIGIILLLASLLLVSARLLRETAEAVQTRTRMDQITAQLRMAASSTPDFTERLLNLSTGRPALRWGTLKEVLRTLAKEHDVHLDRGADWAALPPNLASIYDRKIGCYRLSATSDSTHKVTKEVTRTRSYVWQPLYQDPTEGLLNGTIIRKQPTLENTIVYWNKRNFTDDHGLIGDRSEVGVDFTNVIPADALGTLPYQTRDSNDAIVRTMLWWHQSRRPHTGTEPWAWTLQSSSPLEESLDATFELMPPGAQEAKWYYDTWPTLSESGGKKPEDPLIQHAWPDSDWDRYEPGSQPPILEAPFGQPIIARRSGERVDQHLIRDPGGKDFSLADFSPMLTPHALRLAGVLNENEMERFRTDRQRTAMHNDSWGNPITIAGAFAIAPRYDLDPGDPVTASHGKKVEYFSDLRGGRDFLRQRWVDLYGFSQAAYLSVAAMGPKRGVFKSESGESNEIEGKVAGWKGTLPFTEWEEEDDRVVYRAAWLQIRKVCDASALTSSAVRTVDWADRREHDGFESMLSAPFEAR